MSNEERTEEETRFMEMLVETTCGECGFKYPEYLKSCPKCGAKKQE